LIVIILASLLVSGSTSFASTDGTASPTTELFPIDLGAKLSLLGPELIVEAVVDTVFPRTAVIMDHCELVSELWLEPIRSIWGETSDSPLRVITRSLPEHVRAGDFPTTQSCGYLGGDQPPPSHGARGVFILYPPLEENGVPTLRSVKYEFLPLATDGSVTVYLRATPHKWDYAEFMAALEREAAKLSLDGMVSESSVVFLAQLSTTSEAQTNPGQTLRIPLQIEHVYKGQFLGNEAAMVLDAANKSPRAEDIARGILNRYFAEQFKRDQGKRALVFGDLINGAEIQPLGVCWLVVDSNNRIQLPGVRVSEGRGSTRFADLARVKELR
jgi:hypothetical protein